VNAVPYSEGELHNDLRRLRYLSSIQYARRVWPFIDVTSGDDAIGKAGEAPASCMEYAHNILNISRGERSRDRRFRLRLLEEAISTQAAGFSLR
jgi:hypothetical protein